MIVTTSSPKSGNRKGAAGASSLERRMEAVPGYPVAVTIDLNPRQRKRLSSLRDGAESPLPRSSRRSSTPRCSLLGAPRSSDPEGSHPQDSTMPRQTSVR